MAAAANNKINLQNLQRTIINSNNSSNLSEKLKTYLSNLERELNDLEYRNVSNLQFNKGITGLNPKLNKLKNFLFGFKDVLHIKEISNDEQILRIIKLFKKKIIDFSSFIKIVSEKIMKNTMIEKNTKFKMILDLIKLQEQLNELYKSYELHLKNSNNNTRKLIKNHSNNIRAKLK